MHILFHAFDLPKNLTEIFLNTPLAQHIHVMQSPGLATSSQTLPQSAKSCTEH